MSPGLFERPQLHEPLILISFLVIASLLFHRSPAKEKPQDPIFDPVLMSLLTLLVPIDLQNTFHACMVFSLQRSAALQTVMCCCSSEKPRQSVEQAAVLGWALPLLEHSWFPSPRYKCLYLFGREYLPLLLFHTISTPKLVNKTCYSNSNQSLHGRLFFFPSLFLHSAAGGLSNGAMGSHQRDQSHFCLCSEPGAAEEASDAHASAFAKT